MCKLWNCENRVCAFKLNLPPQEDSKKNSDKVMHDVMWNKKAKNLREQFHRALVYPIIKAKAVTGMGAKRAKRANQGTAPKASEQRTDLGATACK